MAKKVTKKCSYRGGEKKVDFVRKDFAKKFLKSARIGAEKIIIEKKC